MAGVKDNRCRALENVHTYSPGWKERRLLKAGKRKATGGKNTKLLRPGIENGKTSRSGAVSLKDPFQELKCKPPRRRASTPYSIVRILHARPLLGEFYPPRTKYTIYTYQKVPHLVLFGKGLSSLPQGVLLGLPGREKRTRNGCPERTNLLS